jgi:DNA-binding response OmpR family regulator
VGPVRLLLVEDSQKLQRSLGIGLRRVGYALDVTGDGADGLRLAELNAYDVIILDLMLPGLDGLTILERLLEGGTEARVLILTARDTIDDCVRGLRAGADDFVTKPFAFDELVARIQALVRRRHGQRHPRLVVGPLEIDTSLRTVARDGNPVTLAPREYALLEYLAVREGELVTRTDIEDHVYGGRVELNSNAVDSAICTLRRRIDLPGEPSLIETRRGHGYILGRSRT